MDGIETINEEIAVNTDDRHPSERRDHPVVVGVDGSESAPHAVRWAALEAAVVAEGKHWLDEAGAVARLAVPDLPVTMEPRVGSAADLLLTESRSAQLMVAVHTWLDVAVEGAWTTLPGIVDRNRVQAQEEKRLDDRLAVWRDTCPGVRIRPVVRMDRPDRALLEQTAGARLLVVGSHGREAFAGMGISSVSQTLLHHADCPVAVARTERT